MIVATRRDRLASSVLLALSAATLIGSGSPAPPSTAELNENVVAFARAKLGQSVGDGSCATLAIAALKAAGAKSAPRFESDADFVWGRRVESFQEALPGDILQFHKAVFEGKRSLPRRRWVSWRQEYAHHTAILSGVNEGGNVVTVLHQNVTTRGKPERAAKNVQETTLRIDSLQKGGWVRIYRPTPALDPAR